MVASVAVRFSFARFSFVMSFRSFRSLIASFGSAFDDGDFATALDADLVHPPAFVGAKDALFAGGVG